MRGAQLTAYSMVYETIAKSAMPLSVATHVLIMTSLIAFVPAPAQIESESKAVLAAREAYPEIMKNLQVAKDLFELQIGLSNRLQNYSSSCNLITTSVDSLEKHREGLEQWQPLLDWIKLTQDSTMIMNKICAKKDEFSFND